MPKPLDEFVKLSNELPEKHVRSILEKELGKTLPKKTVMIGNYTHEFDLFTEDGTIVGEVKSGRDLDSTGKIKSYRFAECCLDCLFLMSVNAERRIFVLTDEHMYDTFKKMIVGLPLKGIEIKLVKL